MKKKLVMCVLACVLVLSCATAMASVKIGSAEKSGDKEVTVTKESDQTVKVTYAGEKDGEYVLMAVADSIGTPTTENINNNQDGVVAYMNQARSDANGQVEFTIHPSFTDGNAGDTYSIYVSSSSGEGLTKIGTFTLDELLALIGDVNGDGEVTGADRIILARYLAKLPGYGPDETETSRRVVLANADVNGQDGVTGADRIFLARYLAKVPGFESFPSGGNS